MKVIEHGMVIDCPDCHCKMIYDLSDVKHDDGDGPYRPGYDYVVCPDCERRISIKK